MFAQKNKITGILLAGGMSQRMGTEKGKIKIGPSYLYQYALQVLEKLCDEVLISTCKKSLFLEKHPQVCDELPGIGPMGGIYTCLKHSSNELNVVLSYDMPLVNAALISHLIEESYSHDIVLPALKINRPEPLCGIYRKGTSHIFEKLISEKRYAVHHAIQQANSNIILLNDQMSFWNPDIFLNINKEEDLNKLPPELGYTRDE
jgi:molybdopterin-guanine dinucleotide biosynthesis protein A